LYTLENIKMVAEQVLENMEREDQKFVKLKGELDLIDTMG
jgi:hypothetical protein